MSDSNRQAEKDLVEQIGSRCEGSQIGVEVDDDFFGDFAMTLEMPAGRNTRSVFLAGQGSFSELLSIPFEGFIFLGRLLAICSYDQGLIEAAVTTPNGGNPRAPLARNLDADPDLDDVPFLVRSQDAVKIEIGLASSAMRRLCEVSANSVSIRLYGLGVTTHDDALGRVEAIANSLFFDIDANLGVPLILARERQQWRRSLIRGEAGAVSFPTTEYDSESMALYWYGRGAARMPLLQFLAFYQVLEFYFPFYSEQEVRQRVKGIVRHPQFNPHSESQIAGLISATKAPGKQNFGGEKGQLRAAIRGCANPEVVREHLETHKHWRYFEQKRDSASSVVLKESLTDDELLDAVADRIYEIRCRIVHTKDSDMRGQLLPFTPEAEKLGPDIRLVEGLARSALVGGSRELRLRP